jgi:hypothetical protein
MYKVKYIEKRQYLQPKTNLQEILLLKVSSFY